MTGEERPMTCKKKFLNPVDIDDAIVEVARLASEAGVSVALIGGVAMELLSRLPCGPTS